MSVSLHTPEILDLHPAPAKGESEIDAVINREQSSRPRRGTAFVSRLRLTALMASSALLGGIAVVVWHRRALTQMRQPAPDAPLPADPSPTDTDDFV